MKRIVSSLLIVSMLAASAPAWAEPPVTVEPVTPSVVTPLDKGQPAPFTGVLLSPPAVAQVVAEHDAAPQKLDLAVKHQIDLNVVQMKYQFDTLTTTCVADKTVLQSQIDEQKRQNAILTDQLKKTTGGPPVSVWIGIGAIGGVVVTVLTVFAVGKATAK